MNSYLKPKKIHRVIYSNFLIIAFKNLMAQINHERLQFTIRRGAVSDVAHLCSLFEREYGNTSHPCLDERYVHNAMSNNSEIWFVAKDEREAAIGCVSVSYNAQKPLVGIWPRDDFPTPSAVGRSFVVDAIRD